MRRLIVAAISVLAVTLPAKAADIISRQRAVVAPAFTWTGFYAGVNLGYGWGRVSDTADNSGVDMNGIVGGGQLGYNWQAGNIVFGVEGDFQGTGQEHSRTVGALTIENRLPWFATLRGRLGLAFDRALVYVTGGAAWANYELSGSAFGVTIKDDATKTAWTVGGGVEWMVWDRWSTKVEYLYVDSGDTSVTLFGTTVTGRAKDHILRAGLNYHF